MVHYSGVKPGEVILIHYWGEEDYLGVADLFMEAVAQSGASPLLLWQSRKRNQKLFESLNQDIFGENYFNFLEGVDGVLDIFAYQPVVLGAKIPDEQMNYYRKYMGQLFQELMKKKRFTQIRIPTEYNAEESGLEKEDFVERMEAAYEVSYDKMMEEMNRDKAFYDATNQILLHTANDCTLSFNLEGRTFIVDGGDGDWPCGEIYVPPVESKTNGTIYYEKIFVEDVGCFEEVKLTILNGVVTGCSHVKLDQWLQGLETNDKVVCELGFGYNPNINSLCGYTVLDEKMKGTFHIAIGNNQMFGGMNPGTLHVDFVGKGTIEVKEGK